jgi:cation diffusion facilitator CzcD-associated flavoprotein CzcO
MPDLEILDLDTDSSVALIKRWLDDFGAAFRRRDLDSLTALLLEDAYWRDLVACTWTITNEHGPEGIAAALAKIPDGLAPKDLTIEDQRTPTTQLRTRFGQSIEAFVQFETSYAAGRGYVRIRRDPRDGVWRAWTFLTSIDYFFGYQELTGERRPSGLLDYLPRVHDWSEQRMAARSDEDREPAVVVVGAGHSGREIAARLTTLGIDTLVLEKSQRVGDNWRNRYRTLYLHNEVWAIQMPYLPFPSTWPRFSSKDKMADWLEFYAAALDLNVWTSSGMEHTEYDEPAGHWNLNVPTSAGEVRTLQPRHLVLATGVFGDSRPLEIEGADQFRGAAIRSQEYIFSSDAAGKRVLVIGTGSSAHDIAKDFHDHGADVTMLQRSTTAVIGEEAHQLTNAISKENGPPVDDADFVAIASPLPLVREFHKDLFKEVARIDAAFVAGLNAAGFKTDYGRDGSGYLMKYYERGGGYYVDVGCTKLIIDGKIKVKQGNRNGAPVDGGRGGVAAQPPRPENVTDCDVTQFIADRDGSSVTGRVQQALFAQTPQIPRPNPVLRLVACERPPLPTMLASIALPECPRADAGAVPTIGIDRAVLHGDALPHGWPAVGGAAMSSGKGQTARSFGRAGIESPYPIAFSESPSIVANDATLTDPPRSHTTQQHPRVSKSYVPLRICRLSTRPTTVTRPPGIAQARRTRRAQSCARNSLSRPLVESSDSHMGISAFEWWAA